MSCPDFIREALSSFAQCFPADDSFAVPTQCVYPSNGFVTVYVRGGSNGCVVSDEGQAITEIRDHGVEVEKPKKVLRQFCLARGLHIDRAKICSPVVAADGLASAISLVASTSSIAAYWGVHNLKTRPTRNLRKELRAVLGLHFSSEAVAEKFRLSGLSGRQYRFDFVVELGADRKLVIDAVTPDAQTINARAVAHFDLARAENPNVIQRLVYDEADAWQASDISLLRMAGELVPVTRLARNIAPFYPTA